jgi:DNA helicase II / ATP-dependent DNA helicase PcrA
VFLPGWEEGLFPHQRALDESGLAGLEEERRLAYVGLTRGKKSVHVSFAQNRRLRGLYQSAVPSRFVDELPEAHVTVVEAKSPFGGAYQNFANKIGGAFGRQNPYGKSRFEDQPAPYDSTYQTPGWQRAQQHWKNEAAQNSNGGSYGDASHNASGSGNFSAGPTKQKFQTAVSGPKRAPVTLEGQLTVSSVGPGAGFHKGDRVSHQKLGIGTVTLVDGNKLTIDFDSVGEKRVVDSFVDRV